MAVIAANLMTEEDMETIRREINARHHDISLMVNAAGIRGLENQSYSAIELTLLTAVMTLWNTVYIERAIEPVK